MDLRSLDEAVSEVRKLLAGDGLDLAIASCDLRAGSVEVEVTLNDAECIECVLPPDVVGGVVRRELTARLGASLNVTVIDARDLGDAPVIAAPGAASEYVIVDPTGAGTDANDPGPGPDAGSLAGRVVGVRVDVLWRSWDWVIDEWELVLKAHGATVVRWRRAQGLAGEEGTQHHRDYEAFLDGIDIAVVGMANCGSCTSWTIKDALGAADRGYPTVAVATAQFEQLAHSLAALYGRPSLRVARLPYPLDVRPEAEVREIARAHADDFLRVLGAHIAAGVS